MGRRTVLIRFYTPCELNIGQDVTNGIPLNFIKDIMKTVIDIVSGLGRQVEDTNQTWLKQTVEVTYFDLRTNQNVTERVNQFIVVEDTPTFAFEGIELI